MHENAIIRATFGATQNLSGKPINKGKMREKTGQIFENKKNGCWVARVCYQNSNGKRTAIQQKAETKPLCTGSAEVALGLKVR